MNATTTTGSGTAATTGRRTSTRVRIGLGIAILLGLVSLPGAFMPTPDGETGPPLAVLILGAVLGLVSIISAVIAWRSDNRIALRITAACVIVNAVTSLPAFFVDVPAGIKLLTAVATLVSLVSVVLMFSRDGTERAR